MTNEKSDFEQKVDVEGKANVTDGQAIGKTEHGKFVIEKETNDNISERKSN